MLYLFEFNGIQEKWLMYWMKTSITFLQDTGQSVTAVTNNELLSFLKSSVGKTEMLVGVFELNNIQQKWLLYSLNTSTTFLRIYGVDLPLWSPKVYWENDCCFSLDLYWQMEKLDNHKSINHFRHLSARLGWVYWAASRLLWLTITDSDMHNMQNV